ncbi:MAG TPA: hypothetical protein VLT15_07365 [Acidimicrobiia bacterium]|nr:hypothetical protein [Acidimicrobiia bacterium]
MKPVLALITVAALTACSAADRWAGPGVDESAAAVRASIDIPDGPFAETVTTIPNPAADTVPEPVAPAETTTAPVAAPPSTTTTTTVPEIDLDLSELDELVGELDRLLGDLGAAMNQTEGEFTP